MEIIMKYNINMVNTHCNNLPLFMNCLSLFLHVIIIRLVRYSVGTAVHVCSSCVVLTLSICCSS